METVIHNSITSESHLVRAKTLSAQYPASDSDEYQFLREKAEDNRYKVTSTYYVLPVNNCLGERPS